MQIITFPRPITEWLERTNKAPGDYITTDLVIGEVVYPLELMVSEECDLGVCAQLPVEIPLSEHAVEALFGDIRRCAVPEVHLSFDPEVHCVIAGFFTEEDEVEECMPQFAWAFTTLTAFFQKVVETGIWGDHMIIFDLAGVAEPAILH